MITKASAQYLVETAYAQVYAHNCPYDNGWMTTISQESIDIESGTEAGVVEYILSLPETACVFVCSTEYGWFVQEMSWSPEPVQGKPNYSLEYDDWYRDGKLMDFELESPFEYFN